METKNNVNRIHNNINTSEDFGLLSKEVTRKLKELYTRIHLGLSITLNDLSFLSEYDKECFTKVFKHTYNPEPDTPQTTSLAVIQEEFQRPATTIVNSIDGVISTLKSLCIEEDIVTGISNSEVLDLITEKIHESAPETSYQYFNSYENAPLLNTTV